MKKLLLSLLLIIPGLNAGVKIDKSACFIPSRLGKAELLHKDGKFFVRNEGMIKPIANHWVDKPLRNIDKAKLNRFTKVGYFSVNQLDNGEYTLKANGRIKGGGPMTASFLYWATKTACWGGVGASAAAGTAAVVTAVVASGGTALAPLTAASTGITNLAVGYVAAGTLAALPVAAPVIVATELAVVTATAIPAVMGATTTIVAGAGTAVGAFGLVVAIETASIAAGAAGMACWFLP